MSQAIYKYKTNFWPALKESYFTLQKIGNTIGLPETALNNLWYCANSIGIFLQAKDTSPEPDAWYPEKLVLSLVELDKLHSFIVSLKKLNELLGSSTGGSVKMEQNNSQINNLGILQLRPEVEKKWQIVYGSDARKKTEADTLMKEISVLYETVFSEVQVAAAVLEQPLLPLPCSAVDVHDIIVNGKKDFKASDFLQTLFAMQFVDGVSYDIVLDSMQYFGRNEVKNQINFEWMDLVKFAILLQCAYDRFSGLEDDSKALLLKSYFYKAIALDIPVRDMLKQNMRDSAGIINYLYLNQVLYNNLEKNEETVALENGKRLVDVLHAFTAQHGGNSLDSGIQKKFVENFYHRSVEALPGARWLQEALYIYTHIKEAQLVKWLSERTLQPDELQSEDLVRLYVYFSFGGNFERLIAYYKQKNPSLPLPLFFQNLADHLDLSNQQNVENCLSLSQVLQKNKLLPADTDLLIFHESDNQFHWNEQLLA